MGQFPNDYSAVPAANIDGTEKILLDDTGTDYILTSELKKALNRVEVNTQTDSYTLVLTDEGKVVRMNKATSNTLTVPPNSSVAFAIGTQIVVRQHGAGTTTIAAGSGVTINGADLEIPDRYGAAVLVKIGADEWDLFMGGASSGSSAVQLSTPVLTATVVDDDQINLTWTNVANESSYKLEWSANGTTGWTQIGGTIAADTLAYNHTGLTASTHYYYRLTAVGDGVSFTDSGYATDDATTDATADVTAPTLVSIVVEDAEPTHVVHTFDETMDSASIPATTDFVIEVDGSPATVDAVSFNGAEVIAELTVPVTNGQVVTSAFTQGTNKLQDAAGNDAANWIDTDHTVTNNVASMASYLAMTKEGAPNDLTESPTGTWTHVSGSGRAKSNDSLASSANGWIEMEYNSNADNEGSVIGWKDANSFSLYSEMKYAVFISASTYVAIDNGGIGSSVGAATAGELIRVARSGGNTFTIDKSTNGGGSWTTLHTFPTTSTAEVWGMLSIVTAGNKCEELKGMGLT